MEPTKENAPAFGYADLSQRMRERIERHFRAPSPGADRSLVIGIFGEWGSGKSTLLEAVGSGFDRPGPDRATLTIPVRFNPWRYEKEQHLIVPLLKKTELALRARLKPDLTPEQQITGEMLEQVQKAARFTGIAALSFLSMFKARVGIPGVGDMNIDPKAGIDQAKALLDEGNEPSDEKDPLTALSSHYFDFEQRLEALTRGGGDGTRLNLLFLIDDLDRCLPEKAVEMLESIKLFLDVEGCAFVVALDDEVVERGVQHRYKDYLFNSHGEKDVRPPITGAEYLEKIIHLPFRLPAPTRNEIRAFLRRFPLFRTETKPNAT
ncbi:MAG: hypothetical protein H6926_03510 [Chromatiales bacterium]|nr:hypothetical protein [Chromatiales bacterium]